MKKEVETLFLLILVCREIREERDGEEGVQMLGSLFSISFGMQVRAREVI